MSAGQLWRRVQNRCACEGKERVGRNGFGSKIEGSAARLGRSRLSEKFRDRRLAARLRRVGRDGLDDPKNLGIGSLAGTGRTARYRLPKNLGVVGSAGTDQTGRFRHSI